MHKAVTRQSNIRNNFIDIQYFNGMLYETKNKFHKISFHDSCVRNVRTYIHNTDSTFYTLPPQHIFTVNSPKIILISLNEYRITLQIEPYL